MITFKQMSLIVLALYAQAATIDATPTAVSTYYVASSNNNDAFRWNSSDGWKLPMEGKGIISFTVNSATTTQPGGLPAGLPAALPKPLSDVRFGLSPSVSQDNTNGIYLTIGGGNNSFWNARKLDETLLVNPTPGGTLPGGTNYTIPRDTKIDVQITVDQPKITVRARVNGTGADYADIFTYTLPTAVKAWNNFSLSGWNNILNFTNIATSALPGSPALSAPSAISAPSALSAAPELLISAAPPALNVTSPASNAAFTFKDQCVFAYRDSSSNKQPAWNDSWATATPGHFIFEFTTNAPQDLNLAFSATKLTNITDNLPFRIIIGGWGNKQLACLANSTQGSAPSSGNQIAPVGLPTGQYGTVTGYLETQAITIKVGLDLANKSLKLWAKKPADGASAYISFFDSTSNAAAATALQTVIGKVSNATSLKYFSFSNGYTPAKAVVQFGNVNVFPVQPVVTP